VKRRDILATSAVGLRAKRARTLLTALGVAIGIAAMVAVVGISASSRADLLADLDRLGTNLLEVSPGRDVFGQDTQLPIEAPSMIRRIAPVQSAAATRTVSTTVRRTAYIDQRETGAIAVVATEPQLAETIGATLAHGRFLNSATGQLDAVVLGSEAARRLGIDSLDGDPLVVIGDRQFAVVGILDPVPLAPDIDRSALIGYDVAKALFGIDDSASTVRIRTDPSQVESVSKVLPATTNPQAPGDVSVSRPSDALAAKSKADTALTTLLLALGGVALLVGAIGIGNVMVISVLERRAEIGLRRALGATKGAVRMQFLTEATLLAGLGGAGGVALGAAITAGYANTQGWRVAIPVTALAGGVLASMLIGALAGLYPAGRAARLAPADAIRPT
jgi:putative ABC transport system permease protein